MKPEGTLKLISGVRDLQIVDADGVKCGIVDDIEFAGEPGEPLHVAAILVGPGAYERRLPGWAYWLVKRMAGRRVTRVPWSAVASITSVVKLSVAARDAGLGRAEDRARAYVPRAGAM